MLKVTQTKSLIGSQREKHRNVMKSIGFRKHQQTLYKNDTPQIRGMIQKVRHLVEWEEINATDIPATPERRASFTIIEGAKAAGGSRKRKAKRKTKKKAKAKKAKAKKKTAKAKTAGKTKKTE